ncbi:MAG: SAM-dependent methyltransferase [Bacteroidetes bacterium]|nr:SAM-dependent methyltransferase [Bacteroidota bacterium]
MAGRLFLIPCSLSDEYDVSFIAPSVIDQFKHIKHFIAEREKSARKFLKNCNINHPQSELIILEIDKHNPQQDFKNFLQDHGNENDIGLLSESGMPAIADPGARAVMQAHEISLGVIPLPGYTSLMLALMASGLGGQQFAFHGYLPKEKELLAQKIKSLEKESEQKHQTQLIIETNYRNQATFEALCQHLQPDTKLCVAENLTLPTQCVKNEKVKDWKKKK